MLVGGTSYTATVALDVDETDLAGVAAELRSTFAERLTIGHVIGKTAFRDAMMKTSAWSALDGSRSWTRRNRQGVSAKQ